MRYFLIFLFLFAAPLLKAELVQVIQLARHGARTPNSLLFPSQFHEKPGELTSLGIVQQYFLGQEIRKRYIEDTQFLSREFNASEIHIKSSWKNRTQRSAFAFTNGLYPQESGVWLENRYGEEFPLEKLLPLKERKRDVEREEIKRVKIDETWAKELIHIVPMEKDLHFHATDDGVCPPAEEMLKLSKKSKEVQEMEKYFDLTLYTQLKTLINFPPESKLFLEEKLNIKKAKSILDHYRCNSFHGHEHSHREFDEKILELLYKVRYQYAYKITLVDELVRSVLASKLLSEFFEYTKAIIEGVPNTPKYVFYSAHDTTMEILFSIFLLETKIAAEDHYNIIPFSSLLSLEIYKEEDHHYVKLLFNDEPQFIKWCAGTKCSLDQFHRILKHYIIPELEEFCGHVKKDLIDCEDPGVCVKDSIESFVLSD